MWYVVKTTNVKEDVAIERCRNAIPYEIADIIFSPSYECKRRYLGEWHTVIFCCRLWGRIGWLKLVLRFLSVLLPLNIRR